MPSLWPTRWAKNVVILGVVARCSPCATRGWRCIGGEYTAILVATGVLHFLFLSLALIKRYMGCEALMHRRARAPT
jgi:hypothetical protein